MNAVEHIFYTLDCAIQADAIDKDGLRRTLDELHGALQASDPHNIRNQSVRLRRLSEKLGNLYAGVMIGETRQ